jgi:hypothetical protein
MTTLAALDTRIPPTTAATPHVQSPLVGVVTGAPHVLLRLEATALLGGALFAYAHLGAGWGLFAALLLVPDLSLLAYLAGARTGAFVYNAAHSSVGPALLAALGLFVPALLPFAAIWFAHVGIDRALGYGLKYGTTFGDTHLGRIGRAFIGRATGG